MLNLVLCESVICMEGITSNKIKYRCEDYKNLADDAAKGKDYTLLLLFWYQHNLLTKKLVTDINNQHILSEFKFTGYLNCTSHY